MSKDNKSFKCFYSK